MKRVLKNLLSLAIGVAMVFLGIAVIEIDPTEFLPYGIIGFAIIIVIGGGFLIPPVIGGIYDAYTWWVEWLDR